MHNEIDWKARVTKAFIMRSNKLNNVVGVSLSNGKTHEFFSYDPTRTTIDLNALVGMSANDAFNHNRSTKLKQRQMERVLLGEPVNQPNSYGFSPSGTVTGRILSSIGQASDCADAYMHAINNRFNDSFEQFMNKQLINWREQMKKRNKP